MDIMGLGPEDTNQMRASINKRNLIVATVIVAILSFDVTRILLQVSTTDGQRGAWGSVYFIMLLRRVSGQSYNYGYSSPEDYVL